MLTADQFNPHDELYAENQDNILDWEGNMVENNYRAKIILSQAEENKAMATSVQVSGIEFRAINYGLEFSYYEEDKVK